MGRMRIVSISAKCIGTLCATLMPVALFYLPADVFADTATPETPSSESSPDKQPEEVSTEPAEVPDAPIPVVGTVVQEQTTPSASQDQTAGSESNSPTDSNELESSLSSNGVVADEVGSEEGGAQEAVTIEANNASISIGSEELTPRVIKVHPGTTVVWINNAEQPVKVRFTRKAVSTTCKAPRGFGVDARGIYRSEEIVGGAVASLCFLEPDEYMYEVDVLGKGGENGKIISKTHHGSVLVEG